MKKFYQFTNQGLSYSSFNFISYANAFLTVHRFGFKVDELMLTLFSDEVLTHFDDGCRKIKEDALDVTKVNALTFYESVVASSDVTGYCSKCFRSAVSPANFGVTQSWTLEPLVLVNSFFYTDEPITDLRFFHAVSSAFHSFEYGVTALKRSFEVGADPFFEKVLVSQRARLKTAKEFFLKDKVSLLEQFKKALPVQDYREILVHVFPQRTGFSSDDFNVSFVSEHQYSLLPFAESRNREAVQVQNRVLNLLELLFSSNEGFLAGPSVFLKLWQYFNVKYFDIHLSVISVNVSVGLQSEFVETLTVLLSQADLNSIMCAIDNDFEVIVESFDSVVDTAVLLTQSK